MSKTSVQTLNDGLQGILLINKPRGKTSFSLVSKLRHISGVKKIGHAGTLDPFATGVMVLLIGRKATRLSQHFLLSDKEYSARIQLGVISDTYDCDGEVQSFSSHIPTLEEVKLALEQFQGVIQQVPPMFSAKKIKGKKLYELARQGKVIEREAVKVNVSISFKKYEYPFLDLDIRCSKGTYVRSIAHDLGNVLGCGGILSTLERVRSGQFHIDQCCDGSRLFSNSLSKESLEELILNVNNYADSPQST